ncbi:hypothetical protein Ddc_23159 [Ditylenchus destructor]|nr:hypothetical protein Ddc_23159 [Ditylenchus destructor]
MKTCFLTALLVCALMAGVLMGQDVPPEVVAACEHCPKGGNCILRHGEWKCRNDMNCSPCEGRCDQCITCEKLPCPELPHAPVCYNGPK